MMRRKRRNVPQKMTTDIDSLVAFHIVPDRCEYCFKVGYKEEIRRMHSITRPREANSIFFAFTSTCQALSLCILRIL